MSADPFDDDFDADLMDDVLPSQDDQDDSQSAINKDRDKDDEIVFSLINLAGQNESPGESCSPSETELADQANSIESSPEKIAESANSRQEEDEGKFDDDTDNDADLTIEDEENEEEEGWDLPEYEDEEKEGQKSASGEEEDQADQQGEEEKEEEDVENQLREDEENETSPVRTKQKRRRSSKKETAQRKKKPQQKRKRKQEEPEEEGEEEEEGEADAPPPEKKRRKKGSATSINPEQEQQRGVKLHPYHVTFALQSHWQQLINLTVLQLPDFENWHTEDHGYTPWQYFSPLSSLPDIQPTETLRKTTWEAVRVLFAILNSDLFALHQLWRLYPASSRTDSDWEEWTTQHNLRFRCNQVSVSQMKTEKLPASHPYPVGRKYQGLISLNFEPDTHLITFQFLSFYDTTHLNRLFDRHTTTSPELLDFVQVTKLINLTPNSRPRTLVEGHFAIPSVPLLSFWLLHYLRDLWLFGHCRQNLLSRGNARCFRENNPHSNRISCCATLDSLKKYLDFEVKPIPANGRKSRPPPSHGFLAPFLVWLSDHFTHQYSDSLIHHQSILTSLDPLFSLLTCPSSKNEKNGK